MTTPHLTPTRESVLDVIAAHPRGDWSDRTYSCGGCQGRAEERFEQAWATREPTDEERVAAHNEMSAFRHPGWTLSDYHAHVADALIHSGAVLPADALGDGLRDRFCDCEGYGLSDDQHAPDDSCHGLEVKHAALSALAAALVKP